jgi:hypothetical protein
MRTLNFLNATSGLFFFFWVSFACCRNLGGSSQQSRTPSNTVLTKTLHPRNCNMPGSPTPSERERADAELKVKEAAEQAALPYRWTQTIKEVEVTVPVPANTKGRDLDVSIKKSKLKVGLKGQLSIMEASDLHPK